MANEWTQEPVNCGDASGELARPTERMRRRTRRRQLLALAASTGIWTGFAIADPLPSEGPLQQVAHCVAACDADRCDASGCDGSSCDGSSCDGCGRMKRPSAFGGLFSPRGERYCPGTGSCPSRCNPPVRRMIVRRPAVAAPTPVPPPAIIPEPYNPQFEEPVIVEPQPVVEQPIQASPYPMPEPFEMPEPVERSEEPPQPSEPPLLRDPTVPPVPPEALSEDLAMPDEEASEAAEASDADTASGPAKVPAARGGDDAKPSMQKPAEPKRKTQLPKAGESKKSAPAEPSAPRPKPPIDDDDIEMGEFEVGQLPASRWRSSREVLLLGSQRENLFFVGGEPDVGTRVHGGGKPFGLLGDSE